MRAVGLLILRAIAAALGCAAVLGLIGAAAVWASEPWLVASLGASVVLQILTPRQKSARIWNTGAGQFIGMGGGYAATYGVGAALAPQLAGGEPVTWIRVAAVAVAIAITATLQRLLHADNPAGGATALLLALGMMPASGHSAMLLAIGIVLVTIIGEAVRWGMLLVERE